MYAGQRLGQQLRPLRPFLGRRRRHLGQAFDFTFDVPVDQAAEADYAPIIPEGPMVPTGDGGAGWFTSVVEALPGVVRAFAPLTWPSDVRPIPMIRPAPTGFRRFVPATTTGQWMLGLVVVGALGAGVWWAMQPRRAAA